MVAHAVRGFGQATRREKWAGMRPCPYITSRPTAELFDGEDGVAAGFLVGFQLQEVALLGVEEEIVEGAEAVGAFVEAGVAALDGLLDHGTVHGIVVAGVFT